MDKMWTSRHAADVKSLLRSGGARWPNRSSKPFQPEHAAVRLSTIKPVLHGGSFGPDSAANTPEHDPVGFSCGQETDTGRDRASHGSPGLFPIAGCDRPPVVYRPLLVGGEPVATGWCGPHAAEYRIEEGVST